MVFLLVLVLCGVGRLNYCMTKAGLGLRAGREDLIIQAASARPKFNPIIAAANGDDIIGKIFAK